MIRHISVFSRRMDWARHLDELTDDEIDTLEALWEIEPWGDDREDLRFRLTSELIYASGGGKDELPEIYVDYLNLKEQEPPSVEESMEAVREAFGGHGTVFAGDSESYDVGL